MFFGLLTLGENMALLHGLRKYIVNVLIVSTIQKSFALVADMLDTAEVMNELAYRQWALAERAGNELIKKQKC